MPDLPTGTVTFVFSDLEGSTKLLKLLGDEGYAAMLATHRQLVRETFAEHGGSEIDTQGDAFFYSFSRARAAVAACVEVQRRHEAQEWPQGVKVRVRLGLHTGEPVVGEEGYTGLDVVRAARIAADGKGGQILLSEATRAIVGDDLPEGVGVRELGERTLKDIDRPEPLYELVYADEEVEPMSNAGIEPAAQPEEDLDPTNIGTWLGIAKRAIREGDNFDPGPMIEQRVLRQIEANMQRSDARRATRDAEKHKDKKRSQPPGMPDLSDVPGIAAMPGMAGPASPPQIKGAKNSVADEIDRLRALHDQGALTDEQYAKAVDRVLSGG
ncbi:MAG TPA: adenylate/guanylate cyclase domain-containing protein [Candidatus Limnocylindrales bacterium]